MSDVLVLNADGSPFSIIPLSVISWQDAIKLMYLGKVQAVENYSDWIIHSQKQSLAVPAVVMTRRYFNNTTKVRFTKQNLLYRDDFSCQYCHEEFPGSELTLDHVVPKSFGGKKSWDNIVCACGPCNWKRGHDQSIRPKNKPHKPTYYELVNKRKKYPIWLKHPSWNNYLQWDPNLLADKPGSVKFLGDSAETGKKILAGK